MRARFIPLRIGLMALWILTLAHRPGYAGPARGTSATGGTFTIVDTIPFDTAFFDHDKDPMTPPISIGPDTTDLSAVPPPPSVPLLNNMGDRLDRPITLEYAGDSTKTAVVTNRMPTPSFGGFANLRKAATGTIGPVEPDGMTTVTFRFTGLIPNALYTVWMFYQTGREPLLPPAPGPVGRFYVLPFGGLPNLFITDSLGEALFVRRVPMSQFVAGRPLPEGARLAGTRPTIAPTNRISFIIGLHSTHQTNANVGMSHAHVLVPGEAGLNFHTVLRNSDDSFSPRTSAPLAKEQISVDLTVHPLDQVSFADGEALMPVGDEEGNNTSGAPLTATLLNSAGLPLNRDPDLPAVFGPNAMPIVHPRSRVNLNTPNFTLGDWLAASGTVTATFDGRGNAFVTVAATGLPKEGFHSVWLEYRDATGARVALSPLGGLPNYILPDAQGNGTLKTTLPASAFLTGSPIREAFDFSEGTHPAILPTDRIRILIGYQSDQQSNDNAHRDGVTMLPGARPFDFHPHFHNAQGFAVFPR